LALRPNPSIVATGLTYTYPGSSAPAIDNVDLSIDAAIPRWNRQSIEPLQAVYRRVPTLGAASETLAPADLSLEDMIRKLGRVVYVSVEDEIANIDHGLSPFFNINTREDMKVAERMLAEKDLSFERSSVKRSQ
jgi:molybdopterin-guanine dinucleotide biosynthesis protein A